MEGKDTSQTPGARLRQLREARGLTLEAVGSSIHVKPKYLEALETQDFQSLLGLAYAKSFLKAYAGFLEADPSLVEEYKALLTQAFSPPPQDKGAQGASSSWWVVVLILGLVGGGLLWTWRTKAGPTPAPQPVAQDTLAPEPPQVPESVAVAVPSFPVDSVGTLQIVAVESTWVEVLCDGESVLRGLLSPQEVRVVNAAREFRVTLGNAGGVELSLNGQALPAPGPRGTVVRNLVYPARSDR